MPELSQPDVGSTAAAGEGSDGMIRVRGARLHNLRGVDVDLPRDMVIACTGVSGSGKSSLAFGTVYAESQRRYLETIAPFARRLLHQAGTPRVDSITGLPPAVALQQRSRTAGARSTVGTITTISNTLRMLLSRAGTYPADATARLDSDAFSPNTSAGACPHCHGLGSVHQVTEDSLVPDPSLTIRQGAIASWPGAWLGKSLRDILVVLGYDVDRPWRELSRTDRDWILFTDEQPVVTVHAVREAGRIQRPYQGTYQSARRHVLHTLSTSASATMRRRMLRFVHIEPCPVCHGDRLRPEALAVTFAGRSVAELSRLPLRDLGEVLRPTAELAADGPAGDRSDALADPPADEQRSADEQGSAGPQGAASPSAGECSEVAVTLAGDLTARISAVVELGLGYLSAGRAVTTLSGGELQRLRLATALRSGLFGVVYVLDEPSAGLHPADTEALLTLLHRLRTAGNTVIVVEHDLDVVRSAGWVVDVGPGAGQDGGQVLWSGPLDGLLEVGDSATARFLRGEVPLPDRPVRTPSGWLGLRGVTRNNLRDLDVDIPFGVLTAITGVSGSGKSTLVGQVADVVRQHVGVGGGSGADADDEGVDPTGGAGAGDRLAHGWTGPEVVGIESVERLVLVDQQPIGRTPRSNLATYTGLFDAVRRTFAATPAARERGYSASRFSFNVAGGRCETCQGEGFVAVELMFLPGTYGPCPTCHGARYNPQTLEVSYRGRSIADVLDLVVDEAAEFFADVPVVARALRTLQQVGLGYLHLGQPATELSGGEAQRIKLAAELQRRRRGHTLYLLDEPTTGLHPADVERLLVQLHALVDAGGSVVVVEHDMDVVAQADWVIDLGPGGGQDGGHVVAAGRRDAVAGAPGSLTARYLARRLEADPAASIG